MGMDPTTGFAAALASTVGRCRLSPGFMYRCSPRGPGRQPDASLYVLVMYRSSTVGARRKPGASAGVRDRAWLPLGCIDRWN